MLLFVTDFFTGSCDCFCRQGTGFNELSTPAYFFSEFRKILKNFKIFLVKKSSVIEKYMRKFLVNYKSLLINEL